MKIQALLIFLLTISQVYSQNSSEGYYKDIFMDGGVDLYNKTVIPAADALGLTFEYIATGRENRQNDRMVGDSNDDNGILLYPDGEPRFRLLHTNGGSASSHGSSLGIDGRNNVRQFYNNGGCYTGVCAGAFITSLHYQNSGTNNSYYHIWPGRTKQTGVLDTFTGHFVETESPLLQYNDFGNDMYIDNVYHDGGCYAREDLDYPANTEVLLRFDYQGKTMHNKISNWAYKNNQESGRLAVIGSHPEEILSGERLELMKAIIQYALEGQGSIKIKGVLENGIERLMNKTTEDNDPDYTKIGDKQYHHFNFEIPFENQQLSISLNAEDGNNFNIYLNKDTYAFRSNALLMDTTDGSNKILFADNLSAGNYYVSVECETTVDVSQLSWGFEYINNLDVLNGIAYSIKIDFLTSTPELIKSCNIKAYPNPANTILNVVTDKDISFIYLSDMKNRVIINLPTSQLEKNYQLDVSSLYPGIYILSVGNENSVVKKKVIKQ